MKDAGMKVDQWTEVFRATGMDEQMMRRWHAEFERRYPAQHQSFLEWIGLSGENIADVRKRAQAA